MEKKPIENSRPEPLVVGNSSEEEKREVKKDFLLKFKEGHFRSLKDYPEILNSLENLEYPKKNYEKKAIKKANEILGNYLKKYTNNSFSVPEENIHIVPNELFLKFYNEEALGVCFLDDQIIFINASKLNNEISKVLTIFHEMTHLVSFVSFNSFENFKGLRRGGLVVYSLFDIEEFENNNDKSAIYSLPYFDGLNEALVTYLEKKHFFDIISSHPVLIKKYKKVNTQENKDFIKKMNLSLNLPEDEVLLIDDFSFDEQKRIITTNFPYYEQRLVLNYLMQEIAEDNKLSKEQVEDLFLKAYFSGQLKNLAEAIEKSFGKGSFRKVGEMTIEENSAIFCLKDLKLKRKEIKRKK